MPIEIQSIPLPLPMRMGSVNCYLLRGEAGFVLIDTGGSNSRKTLTRELQAAGCTPENLKLIVLTHGDFDHTGNAAYLRDFFHARLAMHPADAAMVGQGDMFAGRKKPNLLIRLLIPLFTGFGRAERFTPDALLAEGDDLSAYGVDAQVLSIPGHSKGSIAILAAGGELFCGDLLDNTNGPALNSLMDDLPAGKSSLARLSGLPIRRVYPGHGQPFELQAVAAPAA